MTRLLLFFFLAACGGSEPRTETPHPHPRVVPETPAPTRRILSIVGTNDVHGRVQSVAVLAGYVANLRRARAHDGAVLLVDGGDMFQGTLESNLNEGAAMVRAYDVAQYTAATVGNHEFDFGPVGPAITSSASECFTPEAACTPDRDPRGALRTRAIEASFPFLCANLVQAADDTRVDWRDMPASTLVETAGVHVGIVGVTTSETLTTTMAANVRDLRIAPLAATIRSEAERLRQNGADVVIVAAHAGGKCEDNEHVADLSTCDEHQEIWDVARELPAGLVDVIVAGHTHQFVAHALNGIAIIESGAYGQAFGRVDLTLEGRRITDVAIHPPMLMCEPGTGGETCTTHDYEGAPVTIDARVLAAVREDLARAAERRATELGVTLETPLLRDHDRESSIGNFLADLMLVARPRGDVAIVNAGGIRNDLPAGMLTYGALFETFPFDNRFAIIEMTGAQVAAVLAHNLTTSSGVLSIAGVRATAACENGELRVRLTRPNGRRIADRERLQLVTSDFLATGGDGSIAAAAPAASAITIEDGEPIREELVRVLGERGGTVRVTELLDAEHPRFAHPPRPVACE